tara:strand:+ start:1925 stop:2413 length:489 start_codon:yes stop_codon:yes gene_type:complete
MKTIQVEDEVYDKLIALATEMTTQDPRCTRGPHLFQIRTEESCAAYEGQGEEVWRGDEGELIEDPAQYLKDYSELNIDEIEFLDEFDTNREMEKLGCYSYAETTRYEYKNCFFTAKACQEHIDANDYHYNKPVNYLNSGWRNPEMELVQEFLCGLVGKKMHR